MKIVVCGAAGRMGKTIIRIISEIKDWELTGVLEYDKHPKIGKKISDIVSESESSVTLDSNPESVIPGADVVIDFTSPQATLTHLDIASKNSTNMVIGTTGFTEHDEAKIKFVNSRSLF